jgi:hypothetical protein
VVAARTAASGEAAIPSPCSVHVLPRRARGKRTARQLATIVHWTIEIDDMRFDFPNIEIDKDAPWV